GDRWNGFWRSVDKKTENRYTAKCKYCLLELDEASNQTIPECKRVRHGQDVTMNEDDQEGLLLSTSTTQSAKQESIVSWCVRPISRTQSERLHLKFLNAIIYGNIPFTITENPYFQTFLQELAPGYQLPS
ncbi:10885_t:CDS:2, partial [Cetraspora pellucida]